ncbi:MAG TPA: MDR family MFS transporter [Myxococcaceae bacterium]|nr:MDR family MFS transporter [Myxococcaceae bacterium]
MADFNPAASTLPSATHWEPPPGITQAQRRFTMTGTLIAMLVAALDQTIVATAGPAIQADLDIPSSLYAWLTTSYMVSSAATLPLFGKLSDLLGRKVTLLAGIGIFVLGSVLCALSPTALTLILARTVQGLGSAALFTSAFAVVADLYSPVERGKYQGLFSAVFGFASVVGPLVGGFVTDAFGWHWVFLINFPVGVIATLMVVRMPALKPHREEHDRPQLDIPGAVLLIATVVPLLLGLSLIHPEDAVPGTVDRSFTSPLILGLGGIAALMGALFIWRERRAPDPLLDLRLFSNRTFALGILATFLGGMTFLSSVVFLPLFMVNVVGLSATASGLTLTPLTLGVVAGNLSAGHLVARLGRYKGLMIASAVILMVGFLFMGLTLNTGSTQAGVTAKMVLLGLGLGPGMPLFTIAIQSAVPMRQVGVATSSATFSRNLGSTIGVAVMGTVFATTLLSHGIGGEALTGQLTGPAQQALTQAISGIYKTNFWIAGLGLLVTFLLPSVVLRKAAGRKSDPTGPGPQAPARA